MTLYAQDLRSRLHRERGVALVVSLIILVTMTLVSVSAMQVTIFEEKMAGMYKSRNSVFQAAEAALRDAEQRIEQDKDKVFNPLLLSNGPFQAAGPNCEKKGYCPRQDPPIWKGKGSDWWTENGQCDTKTPRSCYVIELLETEPSSDSSRIYAYLRITARSTNTQDGAALLLQSTYLHHAKSFAY